MALIDGIKVVAVSGTQLALAAEFTSCAWLMLYGHDDNAGHMFVGASTVVPSVTGTERGMRIPKLGESSTSGPLFIPGPLDLSKVFVDTTDGGDSLTFMYDDNASPILAGT